MLREDQMDNANFLDERPATAKDASRSQRSFLRFAVACGIGVFSVILIAVSRSRLAGMFADFEIPLSPITRIALSNALPIAMVTLVIATIGVEIVAKLPSTRNAWNAIAIGLALACLATYIIGVSLPLMQLIIDLS